MPTINVGFDGSDTKMMYAGPGDTLRTEGLANCIAVVAYDNTDQCRGAVMRHYDTVHAFGGVNNDPISRGNALVFESSKLLHVKGMVEQELKKHVPQATIRFAIGLGSIWHNVDQIKSLWQSRHNLIHAVKEVFDVEPSQAGSTATFVVNTKTLSE